MVNKLLLLLFAVAFVTACNNNTQENPEPASGTTTNSAGVTAADVSGGQDVPLDQIKFDTLTLHLKANDKFSYKVKMTTKMRQDSNELVKDEEILLNNTVNKVNPNGDAIVTTLYKKMVMKAKLTNLNSKQVVAENAFNSSDTADLNNPRTQQFAVMLDAPIKLTITPKAIVSSIDNVNKIAEKVVAKAPVNQGAPKPSAEDMQQLEAMIKENLIATFVSTTFSPLPDSTISPSGEWTRTQSNSMNPIMSSTSTTTFKITNVRNVKGHRIATINGVIKGKITVSKPPQGMQVPEIKLTNSTIEGTSEVVLDLDTGVLISNKGTALTNVEGVMALPGGPKRNVLQRQELVMSTELQP